MISVRRDGDVYANGAKRLDEAEELVVVWGRFDKPTARLLQRLAKEQDRSLAATVRQLVRAGLLATRGASDLPPAA